MQFCSNSSWRPPTGASGDAVNILSVMMHDEPMLQLGIRLLQNFSLTGGIQLRFQGNVPPTPNFSRHIEKHYLPFCREAIYSFMMVGFAPYRIRTLESGIKIPEVLPLVYFFFFFYYYYYYYFTLNFSMIYIKGTYSWYIARNSIGMPTAWYSSMDVPLAGDGIHQQKQRGAVAVGESRKPSQPPDEPILRYEVTSVYSTSNVSVYTFTQPQALFTCSSQLSSLIEPYIALCHKRACMRRADMYNSQLSAVFEQQDKGSVEKETKTGGGIVEENIGMYNGIKRNMELRQTLQYEVLAEHRLHSNLPEDAVTIFAPINHSVHGMDKVISPQVSFLLFFPFFL